MGGTVLHDPDEEERKHLRLIFECCDVDGKGNITPLDLLAACKNFPEVSNYLGIDNKHAVYQVLNEMAGDPLNRITWEEFLSIIPRHYQEVAFSQLSAKTRERLIFDVMSPSTGSISLFEMADASLTRTTLNEFLVNKEVRLQLEKNLRTIHKAGRSACGYYRASFEEFVAFFELAAGQLNTETQGVQDPKLNTNLLFAKYCELLGIPLQSVATCNAENQEKDGNISRDFNPTRCRDTTSFINASLRPAVTVNNRVARPLEALQIGKLLFDSCDRNDDSLISSMDLKICCINYPEVQGFLGINRQRTSTKVFRDLDTNKDDYISWEEFAQYVVEHANKSGGSPDSQVSLETRQKMVFERIPKERSGRVYLGDMSRTFTENVTRLQLVVPEPGTDLHVRVVAKLQTAFQSLHAQGASRKVSIGTAEEFSSFVNDISSKLGLGNYDAVQSSPNTCRLVLEFQTFFKGLGL